jgi:NADH:ubiquinone oxidoreductase subunit 3 (subunit A)
MIYGIILIALGLLAVPSLVLAKKPNAREIFDKVAPYQGGIGILAILLGIWDIIHAIQNLGLLGVSALGIFVWVLIVARAWSNWRWALSWATA